MQQAIPLLALALMVGLLGAPARAGAATIVADPAVPLDLTIASASAGDLIELQAGAVYGFSVGGSTVIDKNLTFASDAASVATIQVPGTPTAPQPVTVDGGAQVQFHLVRFRAAVGNNRACVLAADGHLEFSFVELDGCATEIKTNALLRYVVAYGNFSNPTLVVNGGRAVAEYVTMRDATELQVSNGGSLVTRRLESRRYAGGNPSIIPFPKFTVDSGGSLSFDNGDLESVNLWVEDGTLSMVDTKLYGGITASNGAQVNLSDTLLVSSDDPIASGVTIHDGQLTSVNSTLLGLPLASGGFPWVFQVSNSNVNLINSIVAGECNFDASTNYSHVLQSKLWARSGTNTTNCDLPIENNPMVDVSTFEPIGVAVDTGDLNYCALMTCHDALGQDRWVGPTCDLGAVESQTAGGDDVDDGCTGDED